MKSIIRKFVDIREGEVVRVLVMFSYVFLILGSYLILKPMTRSLFLKNLGPGQLPLVYMMVALVVGFVAVFYAKLSASIRLDRLINGTTLFLIANLLFFWWLLFLNVESAWLYYGFYIWVSIYGVLTVTQFWLLANYVFNPREAKRIFPLLTAGAIAGSISGGYLTSAFVKQIGGTTNLPFFCIGFLAATIFLINLAWRYRDKSQDKTPNLSKHTEEGSFLQSVNEVIVLIRDSRHLALLMAVVSMVVMVSQIADFQFSSFANEAIEGTDELTGFIGFWMSNLSVISFLFQILFAGVIIRRFGVGITVMFLPIVMFASSLWVFLGYGLVSILALKISDGAFRYSINRAGIELLFLPIPHDVKRKTKAFIDMFADRFARGVSGFLLLIFYSFLGLSVAQISLVALALVGIWLAVVLNIRREYVNSFRKALEKRVIDLSELRINISEASTIEVLIHALDSKNERQVVYALELLESAPKIPEIPQLENLIFHNSSKVRAKALRVLHNTGILSELIPDVEKLLEDENSEVRAEVVYYLCTLGIGDSQETMKNFLYSSDYKVRGAAIDCIAQHGGDTVDLLDEQFIAELISKRSNGGESARTLAAKALGIIDPESPLQDYLRALLKDESPEVTKHAVESAGKIQRGDFVPILLGKLCDRDLRRNVREALANYGKKILHTLQVNLIDPHLDITIRRNIPDVLFLIRTQETVDVLINNIKQDDVFLRYKVIKALSKMRNRYPELNFDPGLVEDNFIEETKNYYQLLLTLYSYDDPLGDNRELLNRALKERLDQNLERIFRLLGLKYPQKDIYFAYSGLTSHKSIVRANAVELLDNLLDRDLRKILIPIIEDVTEVTIATVIANGNSLFDIKTKSRKETLAELINGKDNWLRTCAIFAAGELAEVNLIGEIKKARENSDKIVKETAELVLNKLAPNGAFGLD